jgi:hypothetical protein
MNVICNLFEATTQICSCMCHMQLNFSYKWQLQNPKFLVVIRLSIDLVDVFRCFSKSRISFKHSYRLIIKACVNLCVIGRSWQHWIVFESSKCLMCWKRQTKCKTTSFGTRKWLQMHRKGRKVQNLESKKGCWCCC